MKLGNVMNMKNFDMVLNNDGVNNMRTEFHVFKFYQSETNFVKVYYQIMD